MIIAATGHRPDKLGGYDLKTRRALGAFAIEALSDQQPDKVICGGALGWDQAVSAACIALDIPFIVAAPFKGQEARWPAEARARYDRHLAQAAGVHFVCSTANNAAYQTRNEWMVDRADSILALWDGSFGGTHNCIVYAEKVGKPVENLWYRWTLPEILWDLF